MLDPRDFSIRHFFPYTEQEKEERSQAIISQMDVVPITKEMKVQFIGALPNGVTLFLEVTDEPA